MDTARNQQVFTQIANEHMDGIYNFARYMVLDRDEAADITQKTFMALFQQMGKLNVNESLKPWLYKVARNNCLDYLKKKKADNFSDLPEGVEESLPSEWPSIENQLDSSLYLEKVKSQIAELPCGAREVLLLKYFEDMTLEQIAQHMDLPLNTVKSHFYRGKAKIFKELSEQDDGYNR